MITNLLPCPSCGRHVRRTQAACPFCSASIEAVAATAPVRAAPSQRLGRAATFAFGAAIGGQVVAGCAGNPVPLYGGPPPDSGTDVGTPDDGGPAPLYGGAPDTGTEIDAGSPADDAGGPAPAYGGPVPSDAGVDSGALVTLYGGAP